MTNGEDTNMAGPDQAAHDRETESDALRATDPLDRADRPPADWWQNPPHRPA